MTEFEIMRAAFFEEAASNIEATADQTAANAGPGIGQEVAAFLCDLASQLRAKSSLPATHVVVERAVLAKVREALERFAVDFNSDDCNRYADGTCAGRGLIGADACRICAARAALDLAEGGE